MWGKEPYWVRGGLICAPLGMLYLVYWLGKWHNLSGWTVIPYIIFFGGLFGFIPGAFAGSFFDLVKNGKIFPIIIFGILTLFLFGTLIIRA